MDTEGEGHDFAADHTFRDLIRAAALGLAWSNVVIVWGRGDQVIAFPAPPDPGAIGTQVGPINTYIASVTPSPPASIHRFGLTYSEIRGVIVDLWGMTRRGVPFAGTDYVQIIPVSPILSAGGDAATLDARSHGVAPGLE